MYWLHDWKQNRIIRRNDYAVYAPGLVFLDYDRDEAAETHP